jgi:hypothetical protein
MSSSLAPASRRTCASCDFELPQLVGGAAGGVACWGCRFERAPALHCAQCVVLAPCCGACTAVHHLCERHLEPPAEGYERSQWLGQHGFDEESEADCCNCADRETGEVDEEERDGCAVCDGTGHVKCGKGSGNSSYLGHLVGVKDW